MSTKTSVDACPPLSGAINSALTVLAILLTLIFFSSPTQAANSLDTVRAENKIIAQLLYTKAINQLNMATAQTSFFQLKRVIEIEPNHIGAWIDLYRVSCSTNSQSISRNELIELRNRFEKKLSPMTQDVIDKLELIGCESKGDDAVRLFVTLKAGYDDNVNYGLSNNEVSLTFENTPTKFLISEDFKQKADRFYELEAAARFKSIFLRIEHTENDKLKSENFTTIDLSTDYRTSTARVSHSLSPSLRYNWRGGARHSQSLRVDYSLFPKKISSDDWIVGITAHVSENRFVFQNDNNNLNISIGPTWVLSGTAGNTSLRLGIIRNYAHKDRIGGNRDGLELSLSHLYKITPTLQIQGQVQIVKLRDKEVYSSELVDYRQDQVRKFVAVKIEKRLSTDTSLALNAFRLINNSNVEFLSFTKSVMAISYNRSIR